MEMEQQVFDVISKQMFVISLTYVTFTDNQQEADKWLILYTCMCTVPTLWQVSITGKCVSNVVCVCACACPSRITYLGTVQGECLGS